MFKSKDCSRAPDYKYKFVLLSDKIFYISDLMWIVQIWSYGFVGFLMFCKAAFCSKKSFRLKEKLKGNKAFLVTN